MVALDCPSMLFTSAKTRNEDWSCMWNFLRACWYCYLRQEQKRDNRRIHNKMFAVFLFFGNNRNYQMRWWQLSNWGKRKDQILFWRGAAGSKIWCHHPGTQLPAEGRTVHEHPSMYRFKRYLLWRSFPFSHFPKSSSVFVSGCRYISHRQRYQELARQLTTSSYIHFP